MLAYHARRDLGCLVHTHVITDLLCVFKYGFVPCICAYTLFCVVPIDIFASNLTGVTTLTFHTNGDLYVTTTMNVSRSFHPYTRTNTQAISF
jgi:hypothetical protein